MIRMDKQQHGRKPTAAIYTLGCKVNQYESEAITEGLCTKGFEMVSFDDDADVYIINTCTVTAESDRKACQVIRRAAGHRTAEPPYIIVTGCMAQTQEGRVRAIEGVNYICGSRNKMSCVDAAVKAVQSRSQQTDSAMDSTDDKQTAEAGQSAKDCACVESAVFDIDEIGMEQMSLAHSGLERTRAYIKIEDGCDNHCTYCAIRRARGNVVSKRPADVLREVKTLIDNGYRELVLTGIEIASYGKDFSAESDLAHYRLVDLLEEIDVLCEALPVRIRLGSLEPTYMKPQNVARMAALHHLAPQFHLSLQSCSDHVLADMRRKYNMRMIREILADIRRSIPDVMFTTDIMTGFPGETETDFAETLAFAKEAQFLHIHVFPYSRRKNTEADLMPNQLPNEEKNRRANLLIDEQKKIEAACYRERALKGGEILFLPETCQDHEIVGHTGNFMELHVAADAASAELLMQKKELCRVKITGAGDTYLIGEIL